MKKITLLLLGFFALTYTQAQQKAVTETGDEVVLYTDGTWQYLNAEELEKKELSTNPKKFKKDGKSSFLLKAPR